MITEQLELAFDKTRQMPEERQAAAVQAMEVIAAQEESQLTDAEIQGVKLAQQAVRRDEYASEDAVRSFFARFRA
jgi:hypothetical protein